MQNFFKRSCPTLVPAFLVQASLEFYRGRHIMQNFFWHCGANVLGNNMEGRDHEQNGSRSFG